MILRSLAVIVAASIATGAAAAPEREAVFGDWSVYRSGEGAGAACFAVSRPLDAAPKALDHGEVYMMVSLWAGRAAPVQPSFHAGYALEPSRAPEMSVGRRAFESYADANEAFIEERGEEAELVEAMKRGATMRVEARSRDGDFAAYEFSLRGVTAAINRISARC